MSVTIDNIVGWAPCQPKYSRAGIEKLIDGRPLSIETLDDVDIPLADKIWLLFRLELFPQKDFCLLLAEMAERALKVANVTGERFWETIEMIRRFTDGQTTLKELRAAGYAAGYAALAVAHAVAATAANSTAATAAAAHAAALAGEREWQYSQLKKVLRNVNPNLEILRRRKND